MLTVFVRVGQATSKLQLPAVQAACQLLQQGCCKAQPAFLLPSSLWNGRQQQQHELRNSPAVPATLVHSCSPHPGHHLFHRQPGLHLSQTITSHRHLTTCLGQQSIQPNLSTPERLVLQHCGSCSLQELLHLLNSSARANAPVRTVPASSDTVSDKLTSDRQDSLLTRTVQQPTDSEHQRQPQGHGPLTDDDAPGFSKAFWHALPRALAACGYKPLENAATSELASLAQLLRQQDVRDAPLVSALLSRVTRASGGQDSGSHLLSLLSVAEWAGCDPASSGITVEAVSSQLLPVAQQFLTSLPTSQSSIPPSPGQRLIAPAYMKSPVPETACSLAFVLQGHRGGTSQAAHVQPVAQQEGPLGPDWTSCAVADLVAVLAQCMQHTHDPRASMQVAVAAASAAHSSPVHRHTFLALMEAASKQAASTATHQAAAATVAALQALVLAVQQMHQAAPRSFALAARQSLLGVQVWDQLVQHSTEVLRASSAAVSLQQAASRQAPSPAEIAAVLNAVKPVLTLQRWAPPAADLMAPAAASETSDATTQVHPASLPTPGSSKPRGHFEPMITAVLKQVAALAADWLAVAAQVSATQQPPTSPPLQYTQQLVNSSIQHLASQLPLLKELLTFPGDTPPQLQAHIDRAQQAASHSIVTQASHLLPQMCHQAAQELGACVRGGEQQTGMRGTTVSPPAHLPAPAATQLLNAIRLITESGAAGKHIIHQLQAQTHANESVGEELLRFSQRLPHLTATSHGQQASVPALLAALHTYCCVAGQHDVADQLMRAVWSVFPSHPSALAPTDVFQMCSRVAAGTARSKPRRMPPAVQPSGSLQQEPYSATPEHILHTLPDHLSSYSLMQLADLLRYINKLGLADGGSGLAVVACQGVILQHVQARLDTFTSAASWRLPDARRMTHVTPTAQSAPATTPLQATSALTPLPSLLEGHHVAGALLLLARVLVHSALPAQITGNDQQSGAAANLLHSLQYPFHSGHPLSAGQVQVHPCVESWIAASAACVSRLLAAPHQVFSLMRWTRQVLPPPPPPPLLPQATIGTAPPPAGHGTPQAAVDLFKASEQALDGFSGLSMDQLHVVCQYSTAFVLPVLGLPAQHTHRLTWHEQHGDVAASEQHLNAQETASMQLELNGSIQGYSSPGYKMGTVGSWEHTRVQDIDTRREAGRQPDHQLRSAINGLCGRVHQLMTQWYRSRDASRGTVPSCTSEDEGCVADPSSQHSGAAAAQQLARADQLSIKLADVQAVLQHAMLRSYNSSLRHQPWLAGGSTSSGTPELGWHHRPSLAVMSWVIKALQGNPGNLMPGHDHAAHLAGLMYIARCVSPVIRPPMQATAVVPPEAAAVQAALDRKQVQWQLVWEAGCDVLDQVVRLTSFAVSQLHCQSIHRGGSSKTGGELLVPVNNTWSSAVASTLDIMSRLWHEQHVQSASAVELVRQVCSVAGIWEQMLPAHLAALLFSNAATLGHRYVTSLRVTPVDHQVKAQPEAAIAGGRRASRDMRSQAAQMRQQARTLQVATLQALRQIPAAPTRHSLPTTSVEPSVPSLPQLLQLLQDCQTAAIPVPPAIHSIILEHLEQARASGAPVRLVMKGGRQRMQSDGASTKMDTGLDEVMSTLSDLTSFHQGHEVAGDADGDEAVQVDERADGTFGILMLLTRSLIASEHFVRRNRLDQDVSSDVRRTQVSEGACKIVAAAAHLPHSQQQQILDLCGKLMYT